MGESSSWLYGKGMKSLSSFHGLRFPARAERGMEEF